MRTKLNDVETSSYLRKNILLTVIQTFTLGLNRLRTFVRKFSNIDFFLKILPLKDEELVMSEM